MAFGNLGNAGTAVGSTSASSFTLTTTGNSFNASSGRFGVLRVAIDNISTSDGPSNDVTSVTGGNGTWTKLGEYTNANGGAGNGVTVALWLFMPDANNAVGTVLTINLSAAVTDRSARFWLHTHTIGDSVRDAAAPVYNEVDAANNFGSCTISGLTSKEYYFISALGKEANTTTTITPSSLFGAVPTLRSRNNAAAVISSGEFRVLTGTGVTSNPTLAVSGDAVNVFVALEEYVPGGSTQNLTPGLLSITKTIHAPSVTVGAASLTPPLVTRIKSLLAPTVAPGAVIVTPGLLTRTKAIFAPSVNVGAVAVTPPLVTRSKSLFAPAVAVGPVALTPPLLVSAKAAYPPTVVEEGGAQTLTPPLVEREKAIYPPSVTGSQVGPVDYLNPLADWAPRPNYDAERRRDIAALFEAPNEPVPEIMAKPEPEKPKAIPSDTFERLASLEGRLSLAEARSQAARMMQQVIQEQEDEEAILLLLAA